MLLYNKQILFFSLEAAETIFIFGKETMLMIYFCFHFHRCHPKENDIRAEMCHANQRVLTGPYWLSMTFSVRRGKNF